MAHGCNLALGRMRREDWHASKVTASAVRPRELRTAEDNSKGTRAAVPIPGRRRQVEGYEFKDCLVYVVGFRTARTVERPCLKHQKPKTKQQQEEETRQQGWNDDSDIKG